MRRVHARSVAAQSRRRKDFGGIEDARAVEGAAHVVHRLQIVVAEELAEVERFILADAVLARDRAAVADAHAKNLAADVFGLRFFAGDASVVEHERMQVAVTGVKDVRDAQTGFGTQPRDLAQHRRDLFARDHAVLHVVVRRDTAHRGKRALAALPHQRAFGVVFGCPDLERAARAQQGDRRIGGVLDIAAHAVDIHQERGADVERPIDAGRRDDRFDRELIHHLDRRGHDPRRDDRRDRRAGFVGRGKGGEDGARRLRQAQNLEALGRLTSGVAHDFNNLLTIILSSLQLLGKRLPPDDARAARLLEAAMQGTRRGAGLTSRLLSFARQQDLGEETP